MRGDNNFKNFSIYIHIEKKEKLFLQIFYHEKYLKSTRELTTNIFFLYVYFSKIYTKKGHEKEGERERERVHFCVYSKS